MKRVSILLIFALAINPGFYVHAAWEIIQQDSAIVKIKSRDTSSYPVRLMYMYDNERRFVSDEEAVNGVYEFHIPVKGYSKAGLHITSAKSMIMSGRSFTPQPAPQFLLRAGQEVLLTADFNNPLDCALSSADPEVLLYEKYAFQERKAHLLIWDQMKIKAARQGDTAAARKAEAAIRSISGKLRVAKKDFVKSHRASFAALMVFESYYTELENKEALHELQSIAKNYHATGVWKELYAKLTSAKLTGEGAKIPAFTATDLDGKIFDSRRLEGKYWLIDFWGSWCQPCRASHPELRKLYEKYRSAGLEILGIAYESGPMDSQLSQWKKAIKEDQINWRHILNSAENDLVKKFGVTSFPTKLLVDADGNIVYRSAVGGTALNQKLEELFSRGTSNSKPVPRDSLLNYLNTLLRENTTDAKATLKKEAALLKNASAEEDRLLALKVYQALDDPEKNSLEQSILKNFPKGIAARDQAYNQVFNKKPASDIQVMEKEYLLWLKAYSKESYPVKNQEKYNFALLALVNAFSKANNTEKTMLYLAQLKEANLRTVALYNVGKDFSDRANITEANKYLAEALDLSRGAKESASIKEKNSFAALYFNNIVDEYSSVLLKEGHISESVALTSALLEENNFAGMNSQSMALTLANGLMMKGEKLNAFCALDRFLHNNQATPETMRLMKTLYEGLNNNQSDFQQYITRLHAENLKEKVSQLKKSMISEKAPAFSLYDRTGKSVRLEDYLGKIVVLDFWATWCVPCTKSFPGMQATVEKYKKDDQVEFLFINTWETKAGFKESVDQLIGLNNYPFTVLYDEQTDKHDELVVKKYGVNSIPAKFVIDKKGNIRFRAAGSLTDKESVLEEMSAMIDMVLNEGGNAR